MHRQWTQWFMGLNRQFSTNATRLNPFVSPELSKLPAKYMMPMVGATAISSTLLYVYVREGEEIKHRTLLGMERLQQHLEESMNSPTHAALTLHPNLVDLMVSSSGTKGVRAVMEDTTFVSPCERFAAIFDGHGGDDIARFLQKQMFALLEPELKRLPHKSRRRRMLEKEVERAFDDTFALLNREIASRQEWRRLGSTAVGVYLLPEMIVSFNLGDSRAILCREGHAISLTRDHKPNDPEEMERIYRQGGSVDWYGPVDTKGQPIESHGAYRVNGNLAVSRALGDYDLGPCISHEAEIKCFAREGKNDQYIVLASDGLWDVFTNDEVLDFVHDVLHGNFEHNPTWKSAPQQVMDESDPDAPVFDVHAPSLWQHHDHLQHLRENMASYLIKEAQARGSSDNISVTLLWLHPC